MTDQRLGARRRLRSRRPPRSVDGLSRVDVSSRAGLAEDRGGAVTGTGVEGIEVAAHGRRRVGMAKDLLDVQQVEVMGAGCIGAVVKDASGAAAKVMRRDVSESGQPRTVCDDPPNGMVADAEVRPEGERSEAARGGADDRHFGRWGMPDDSGDLDDPTIERVGQGSADRDGSSPIPLSGPMQLRWGGAHGLPREAAYLFGTEPVQPEADDQFVTDREGRVVAARVDELTERLAMVEPSGRVRGLQLPVDARRTTDRLIWRNDPVEVGGREFAIPGAPAKEGPEGGGSLANRVVGQPLAVVAGGRPLDVGRFGEVCRVGCAGPGE